MKYLINIFISILCCTATFSFASGSASFTAENSNINLYWLDSGLVRMDFNDKQSTSLFIMDKRAFIAQQFNNQYQVFAITDFVNALGSFITNAAFEQLTGSVIDDWDVHSFKDTGKTQAIAGIAGQIYQVSIKKPNANDEVQTIVLTDNALVVEMTKAYLQSVQASISLLNKQALTQKLPNKHQGLLAIPDRFQLVSITNQAKPKNYFALPAKPTDLGKMLESMQIMIKQFVQ